MVYFESLISLLCLSITLPNLVDSSIIPDDEIIWKVGMPFPQAVKQLQQRVVDVLQQNPGASHIPFLATFI